MRRKRPNPSYKGQYTHIVSQIQLTEKQDEIVRTYSQQNNLKDSDVIRAFIEIYDGLTKLLGGHNKT